MNFDINQLNNCCRCSKINCSQLLLVPCNTTGVYLTYSNNINFLEYGIRWEIAFKPTHVPRYINCQSC